MEQQSSTTRFPTVGDGSGFAGTDLRGPAGARVFSTLDEMVEGIASWYRRRGNGQ